jgi:hypothetical protein
MSIDSLAEEPEPEDSAAAVEENTDTLPLAGPAAIDSTTPSIKPRRLTYPGISVEQDSLARLLVRCIWMFEWDNCSKIAHKMGKIERKERLPALSGLLLTSAYVIRIQNREFSDEHTEKNCRIDLEKASKDALESADPSKSPDSLLATNLLIFGGVKGLLATLQIDRNLIAAAAEGLSALNILEKCIALDTSIADAALGLGIFYCALSKAPAVVRGALSLMGKPVSFDKGLEYLRRSAHKGRFTSVMAQLYLIEFLSPFLEDQAAEKRRIFKRMKIAFPENPYFLFLELEENLCFHPEKVFDPSVRRAVRIEIASLTGHALSETRYAMLTKWQYALINPFAAENLRPDTVFNLREFSYYPVFLSALREKFMASQFPGASPAMQQRRILFIRRAQARAQKLLRASAMGSSWKGFYAWHIRDALRTR